MSFEDKDAGTGLSHVRDVLYSDVTERLPAPAVTQTAEAFQQLFLNNKAPPFIQRVS